MTRDLSRSQFLAALEREGFEAPGFMGYVPITVDGKHRVSVSVLNAGDRRRSQLAHLIRERKKVRDCIRKHGTYPAPRTEELS